MSDVLTASHELSHPFKVKYFFFLSSEIISLFFQDFPGWASNVKGAKTDPVYMAVNPGTSGKEKLYQNDEKLYQSYEKLYQSNEKLYQSDEKLYQRTIFRVNEVSTNHFITYQKRHFLFSRRFFMLVRE